MDLEFAPSPTGTTSVESALLAIHDGGHAATAAQQTVAVAPPPADLFTVRNVVSDYDVRTDTDCVLTFPHEVTGLNDAACDLVFFSVAHAKRHHRDSTGAKIRIMGSVRNEEDADAGNRLAERTFAALFTATPQLEVNAVPAFQPILLCHSKAHQLDNEYIADKCRRILQRHTEQVAAEDDALRRQWFEEKQDMKAKQESSSFYERWQEQFMRQAALPFAQAPAEKKQDATEARKPKGLSKKEVKAWRKKQKQKQQQQQQKTARGATQGAVRPLIPGILQPTNKMRSKFPQQPFMAVVIVLDNTGDQGDGLDEHLVFPLRSFTTEDRFRQWAAFAHPHMRRYQLHCMPTMAWIDVKKFATTCKDLMFHNKTQQHIYDVQASRKATASRNSQARQGSRSKPAGDIHVQSQIQLERDLVEEGDDALKELLML